jgi:histidinol dehydrogenase
VVEYTRRFDGLDVRHGRARAAQAELLLALDSLRPEQREALDHRRRPRAQLSRAPEGASPGYDSPRHDGTRLGQKVTPLDRVGLYVPGGRASYPSSVLMNAIPAKVAGVSAS